MGQINFRCVENAEIRKAGEERKLTFVASDGSRDSAHTVLNQANWDLERFNSNGIIGYQHKVYGGWDDTDNPDNVIGKGRAYVEDGKLMVDVEFEPPDLNPLADKVYRKLQFGTLNAVSVGFTPFGTGHWGTGEEARGAEHETYYYEGQTLYEVSVVNIPANPNALKKDIAEALEAELKALHEENPEESKADEEARKATEQAEREALDLKVRKATTIARAALL